MAASHLRLVLDTNVLLAGLTSRSSASQRIVDALQRRRAVPLLSPAVLAEYRQILGHPSITKRFPMLTSRRVELALARLSYIGDEYEVVRVGFSLPRDPQDAMFVELAIVGNATHIVTVDADLLSLPTAANEAGKRFRQRAHNLQIVQPASLLRGDGAELRFD